MIPGENRGFHFKIGNNVSDLNVTVNTFKTPFINFTEVNSFILSGQQFLKDAIYYVKLYTINNEGKNIIIQDEEVWSS